MPANTNKFLSLSCFSLTIKAKMGTMKNEQPSKTHVPAAPLPAISKVWSQEGNFFNLTVKELEGEVVAARTALSMRLIPASEPLAPYSDMFFRYPI